MRRNILNAAYLNILGKLAANVCENLFGRIVHQSVGEFNSIFVIQQSVQA